MSSDGASTTDAAGHKPKDRGSAHHHHAASKTPPTPPGSPVDRPMPASTTICKDVLGMIREEGDGCRHGKSRSKTTRKSAASHRSTNNAGTDQPPPREPSDGYQVLDDVPGESPAGTSSDQHQQQQQQAGTSSTSDSDDNSSEFDWSEDDDADSSDDDNSVVEGKRPARDAADGMSSDSESECLI